METTNVINWVRIWVTKCADKTLTRMRSGWLTACVWTCTDNWVNLRHCKYLLTPAQKCSGASSDSADVPVFFWEARLAKCYSQLVLPAPGCPTSSSLTVLWGWLLIFMKILCKLPSLHSTSRHVPLILEHSESGPRLISLEIFFHFACKRWHDQKVSLMTGDKFFFSHLSNTPSFFLHIILTCWLKGCQSKRTSQIIATHSIVAAFCVIRQTLLIKQNDFTSLALMVWLGLFFLVFFAQGQHIFFNIKVRKNTLKKERKIAFPMRGAACDPGALSLLIMCLEIPGRQQRHFLPTGSGPLLQWQ